MQHINLLYFDLKFLTYSIKVILKTFRDHKKQIVRCVCFSGKRRTSASGTILSGLFFVSRDSFSDFSLNDFLLKKATKFFFKNLAFLFLLIILINFKLIILVSCK